MRFDTFCIAAGTEACTARCKWCVASMTPTQGIARGKPKPIDHRIFKRACEMARQSGLDTARLTGKGEPTIYPDQITEFLELMQPYNFSFVEIQTHGYHMAKEDIVTRAHMERWADLGLTHVCLSLVSYDQARNHKHYMPHKHEYYDVAELVAKLHAMRMNVRLTCIMQKGDIDNVNELKKFLAWARAIEADQVTILPVNKPDKSRNDAASLAASDSQLTAEQLAEITAFVEKEGVLLRTLLWGAKIYDLNGQNLCFNSCLTLTTKDEDASRQLIFYTPGTIGYDWQHAGATLFRLHSSATPAGAAKKKSTS